ncbi:MAG: hypothetical protein IPJ13_32275 [Saprospiraceae bacterium]|nr:hypothetical protein [Saprospiraceae bacterium]
MLFIGALLVITSRNISKKPWYALGVDWIQPDPLVWILSVAILLIYSGDLLYGYINKSYFQSRMDEMQHLMPLTWDEFKHYIFLAFSLPGFAKRSYSEVLLLRIYHIMRWNCHMALGLRLSFQPLYFL